MTPNITHYCQIMNQSIYVDGENVFATQSDMNFQDFIKLAYKHYQIDYRKFYKMDPLCKLALVGSHILLENQTDLPSDTAILLSNRSACIDIDLKHQENVNSDDVSPADFVYTLPNIALGELSIKYQLRSENSFFIFDKFNPRFLVDYGQSLLKMKKASSILGGWLEINQDKYNGYMFLVAPKPGQAFTAENLKSMMISD